MYNPKFYTTERNGELALWVEMPNGESYNIYDVSKDFLYTRIEKGLLTERKIFKGHMEDIYLNHIPRIENEIKKREINNNK